MVTIVINLGGVLIDCNFVAQVQDHPTFSMGDVHMVQEGEEQWAMSIRPGAVAFLTELSKQATCHLITEAGEACVRQVLTHLDPTGTFFGDRIHVGCRLKSLTGIRGDRVVAVDDSYTNWDDTSRVMKITPFYTAFKQSVSALSVGYSQRYHAMSLAHVQRRLLAYCADSTTDVATWLTGWQLPLFRGMIGHYCRDPNPTLLNGNQCWALQCGMSWTNDPTQATHLFVRNRVDGHAFTGMSQPILSSEWLWACLASHELLPTIDFNIHK